MNDHAMGKDDGDYSETKGAHSNQRSKVHKRHTIESKKRQFEQLIAGYDVLQEFSDYPPFKSKVIDLGPGNNWILVDDKLREADGDDWLVRMFHLAAENESFHVRTQSKSRVYYRQRKIRDRDKLDPRDKTHRAKTDLRRYTIDLRPDHSRAVEKMLSAGKVNEARELVDKIRDECIRLFQEIYHRDVRAVAEHTDSGQLHFDLWHTGIREVVVQDSCAKVVGGAMVNGQERLIRERTEYRAYGVGVGVASWNRHRSAIQDLGKNPTEIMNNETLDTIRKMSKLKMEQTKESPRDLRYYTALDKYVAIELHGLAHEPANQALSEYFEWLAVGYKTKKLGKLELTEREKKMATKIKQLRNDNDNLKQAIQNTNYEQRTLLNSLEFILEFLNKLKAAKSTMKELIGAGLKKSFDSCLKLLEINMNSKSEKPMTGITPVSENLKPLNHQNLGSDQKEKNDFPNEIDQ